MTRRDAMRRLHETLQARRADLQKLLKDELTNLRGFEGADSSGDSADAAFAEGSHEISSLLAELDSRELKQIERVLARLEQGVYGRCEGESAKCQKNIPMARLNVLPNTTFCIHCEREKDKHSERKNPWSSGNWEKVSDLEVSGKARRINLSHMEKNLTGNSEG